jgi:flagellar biosynthesis protein FlhG
MAGAVKAIPELDHYELLELPHDATREDVERAYRLARSTWAEDALAAYSVAGKAQLAALRERVEAAYRVLADVEARGAYDEALGALRNAAAREAPELDVEDEAQRAPAELPAEIEPFDDFSGPEDGIWSGAALRRSRLARGLELEQITAITKVSPVHLRSVEEERFEALPAAVYVRGFVVAFARCLGLDAGRVANDYLERLQAARPERARRRPRGRP